MGKLATCPFCGTAPIKGGNGVIFCDSCGTARDNNEYWNRRAMPAEVARLVETARVRTDSCNCAICQRIQDRIAAVEKYYATDK